MFELVSGDNGKKEQALLDLLYKSNDTWLYHFPCWRRYRYLTKAGQKDLSFVLLDQEDQISCFFTLLLRLKKNRFLSIRHLESAGYVFPPHFSTKKRHQLLAEALKVVDLLAKKYGVDELMIWQPSLAQSNLPPLREDVDPYLWHYPFSQMRVANLIQCPTVFARIIDLSQDINDIWHSFSYACQKQIKKSERGGLKIEHGSFSDFEQIYHILETTFNSSKQPFEDKNIFKELLKDLLSLGFVKIFLASYQGNIIGVLLNEVYQKQTKPRLTGSIRDYNFLGTNNFLHWQAIQYFKNLGFKWFMLGLTFPYLKDMGVRYRKMYNLGCFKDSFGGKLFPIYGGEKVYSIKKRLFLDFIDNLEMQIRASIRRIMKRR